VPTGFGDETYGQTERHTISTFGGLCKEHITLRCDIPVVLVKSHN